MRDATTQWLTWGTIAGSVVCAMWLAVIDGEAHGGALTATVDVGSLLPEGPALEGSTPRLGEEAAVPPDSAGSASPRGR